ncbi:MAG TPA: class E sortase [Actinomycetota bacterium]|nr:class E sortase [Actinomycetota bacterium]
MLHPKSTAGAAPPAPPAPRPSRARRRRLLVNRAIALLALALVATGLALLSYPLATDLYTARAQARLRAEFAAGVAGARPGPTGPVGQSHALAVIEIPAIGLDEVVVEGTQSEDLRAGPGHYSASPPPCGAGNAAIAGHRTTYGEPFNQLDQLTPGETITLITRQATCTYEVLAPPPHQAIPRPGAAGWVVPPDAWSVVGPLPGNYLTLTTCTPKGSATDRLVVRAREIP